MHTTLKLIYIIFSRGMSYKEAGGLPHWQKLDRLLQACLGALVFSWRPALCKFWLGVCQDISIPELVNPAKVSLILKLSLTFEDFSSYTKWYIISFCILHVFHSFWTFSNFFLIVLWTVEIGFSNFLNAALQLFPLILGSHTNLRLSLSHLILITVTKWQRLEML